MKRGIKKNAMKFEFITLETICSFKRRLPVILFILITLAGAALSVSAQDNEQPKFKIGDRVECDQSGSRTYWKKGTVVAFKENDIYNGYAPDSGYFYRVRLDSIPDAPENRRRNLHECRLINWENNKRWFIRIFVSAGRSVLPF